MRASQRILYTRKCYRLSFYTHPSCIALWGDTVYTDATGGTQPIGTLISGNVMNEIGIYQKQSSGVFQAKSAFSKITRNIMFNQPRAAVKWVFEGVAVARDMNHPKINSFNDGMGGGSEHSWNLLFNTCRESSDHSVGGGDGHNGLKTLFPHQTFNSWDRQPFLTTYKYNGRISTEPISNVIHHNFHVNNYGAAGGGIE